MKAIIWDEASQGMKFDYRDIPAELLGRAQEVAREAWSKPPPKPSEELMNKYLEDGRADRRRDQARPAPRAPSPAKSSRCCAAPPSRTRACSACSTRVIEFMPSPIDIPPVPGTDDDDKPVARQADDNEKFAALAFKLMTDPFVGQLTFVRVYSGVLQVGRHGLQPDPRQEGAHRPDPADARQPARGNQGNPRRRHRRLRRPEGRDHRRNAVRPGRDHHARAAWCSRSR